MRLIANRTSAERNTNCNFEVEPGFVTTNIGCLHAKDGLFNMDRLCWVFEGHFREVFCALTVWVCVSSVKRRSLEFRESASQPKAHVLLFQALLQKIF